jgi:hypothetical protein
MPENSVPHLLDFNVFGLMRVNRGSLVVNATAMTSRGRSITRTFQTDLDQPIEAIAEGQYLAVVFGLKVEEGKRTRAVFTELNPNEFVGVVLDNIPEVGNAVAKVAQMVKAGLR